MKKQVLCAVFGAASLIASPPVAGQQIAVGDSVEILSAAIRTMVEETDQETITLVPEGGQSSVITASALAATMNLQVEPNRYAALKDDDLTARKGVVFIFGNPVINNDSAKIVFWRTSETIGDAQRWDIRLVRNVGWAVVEKIEVDKRIR